MRSISFLCSVCISCRLISSKEFSLEKMAAGENRFAPELNEREAIKLLGDLHDILGTF